MIHQRRRIAAGLLVVLLLSVTATAAAGMVAASDENTSDAAEGSAAVAGDRLATTSTLVVDDDGGADFTSIRDAVHHANDGDTVEVRPGTYEEEVSIGKDITLVAPEGATLDGTSVDEGPGPFDGGKAINIGSSVAPTVRGFTIVNYNVGVQVSGPSEGAWTVADLTIRNSGWDAIRARRANGDWTIRDSTVVDNAGRGIVVDDSTGDWLIEGTTVRNNDGDPGTDTRTGVGIDAGGSTGAWTIRDSVVSDHIDGSGAGIDAASSEGDWTIQNTTIADNTRGLSASVSSGSWTVTDSTFMGNKDEVINAPKTTGAWSVQETAFLGDTVPTIDAVDASPAGDATGNWWGSADGASESDCIGNVDCGEHLGDSPVVPSYREPSNPTVTDEGTYFVGQTLYTDTFAPGDSVELRSGTPDGDNAYVTQAPANNLGEIRLPTRLRSPGEYYLTDGTGTTVTFQLLEQQLSVSADRSTVDLASDSTVEFSLTSNRESFDLLLTSVQFDEAALAAALDDGVAVDTSGDGTTDAVRVDGSADRTLSADLADFSTGSYSIDFTVPDTQATASQSLTVERSALGTVTFEPPSKVVSATVGNEAEIPLTFQDTDTAMLTVGGDESDWQVSLTVSDDDGDGSATVLVDTAAIGQEGTVFSASGGDSVSGIDVIEAPQFSDAGQRINASTYQMSTSVDGRETDVATLSLDEASSGGSSDDSNGPGFGPAVALVALLLATALLSRRQN